MVTGHLQPDPRVGRPGRESNPVHGLSQGPADIQSQGAIEERSLNAEKRLVFCSQSGTGSIVRRGLRAPSARQGLNALPSSRQRQIEVPQTAGKEAHPSRDIQEGWGLAVCSSYESSGIARLRPASDSHAQSASRRELLRLRWSRRPPTLKAQFVWERCHSARSKEVVPILFVHCRARTPSRWSR
jgi:hypothetical protein